MRSRERSSAKSPVFIFDFGGVVIKWKNNNPTYDYIAHRYKIPRAELRRVFDLALPRLESGEVSIEEFLSDHFPSARVLTARAWLLERLLEVGLEVFDVLEP
jgi:FMN phosphatase YigB (HAD superfamily)